MSKKKEKPATPVAAAPDSSTPVETREPVAVRAKSLKFTTEGDLSRLHRPGENPQLSPETMKEHLKRTGGKVLTRFPPEPNGFLHIGHAKAINVNFAYAEAHGGECNLRYYPPPLIGSIIHNFFPPLYINHLHRYDDTNPDAEEQRYLDSILESIKWLGFKPSRITYSSDYFPQLYSLACELIRRDKAYVCHCTGEEIYLARGGDEKGPRYACKHRSRPIEESLREFERMKNGEYAVGAATLRMKMDLENPNPQFWYVYQASPHAASRDLVAYRVMFSTHHRTGDEWCIYPTYDYTHCLVDSFEDITHSMCTVEFVLSRESYYWLVDALEVYKPVQWEYGRLKLTNTVLSKRKLAKLISEGHVAGWDDPRLHTIDAVRRRGFTPEAINAFVREVGVSTSNSTIQMVKLESYVRDHLNETADRKFVLEDPLRVTLENLPHGHVEEVEVPNKPRAPERGSRMLPFGRVVYIDASDFREEADANFYRLSVGGSVGLLHVPYPITCTRVIKDSTGKILELVCKYDNEKEKFTKPKTYIQWVGQSGT